jgi:hypothetical protein
MEGTLLIQRAFHFNMPIIVALLLPLPQEAVGLYQVKLNHVHVGD